MISVIIPVYHNEETLQENLFFLGKQKYLSEKILIFDGYRPTHQFSDSVYSLYAGTKLISNYPDVPWGNARARNIGAINASKEWLLFLDVDHTFRSYIDSLFFENLSSNRIYRFKRNYGGETVWPSGSILIHRDVFFKIGGYNEIFCGNYGYEDLELIYRAEHSGYAITNSKEKINVLPAGRVRLPRDTSVNMKLYDELRK